MNHPDLSEQISELEAQIETLAGVIERCRKVMLISKVAMAAGAALILAILVGATRFEPTALLLGITAVVGGIVLFGSNSSTSEQAATALKAAEAQRAELIDKAQLRLVDDGVDRRLPYAT